MHRLRLFDSVEDKVFDRAVPAEKVVEMPTFGFWQTDGSGAKLRDNGCPPLESLCVYRSGNNVFEVAAWNEKYTEFR